MKNALALVLALSLALPAVAQDTPFIEATPIPPVSCKPGDVVLSRDAAVAAAKRLKAAEAKVEVYEKNPPLPWWGVLIIGVVAAGAGVGATVAIYEAAKPKQ